MQDRNIAGRVYAGMNWLETRVPGWVDRLDLVRLDMQDELHSILGQLFPGLKPAHDMSHLGFVAQEAADRDEMSLELWYLETEWTRQVLLRREGF